MSEFHEGKIAGIYLVGIKADNKKEAYEEEVKSLFASKNAFGIGAKRLNEYLKSIYEQRNSNTLTVKESEYAIKYTNQCISLILQLQLEAEEKYATANGSLQALNDIVQDIKCIWDDEKNKLENIKKFEASKNDDISERPVGYLLNDSTKSIAAKQRIKKLKKPGGFYPPGFLHIKLCTNLID